jgi:CRISPR-associated protein Csm1
MDNKRQLIYLGAMLHDIGKLAFRSQKYTKGEGHELLGEKFIRENIGKIEVLKDDIEKILNESKHNKIPTYCRIADRIASQERETEESKITRRPLISILNSLSLDEEYKEKRGIFYFKPEIISKEKIFPQKDEFYSNTNSWKYDDNKSIKEHLKLYDEFKKEIEDLRFIKSFDTVINTLFYLLNKYTSRVCSAGHKSTLDISLFDHSRAIGGLVNCLTYALKEEDLEQYNANVPDNKFLFIKGDLTGIQKFIYSNISLNQAGGSKDISKKLRGRSFYVSLLNDFIANLFIEKLELTEANIFYAGGGHFIIIAPFNKKVENIISNLSKEVNLFLLDKIGTRLNLVIGQTICDNSLYTNTNEFISKVNFDLNNKKFKTHAGYLTEVLNKDNKIEKESFKDDLKIGEVLPYANYIIEVQAKDNTNFNNDKLLVASFEKFNKYYFMIKEKGSKEYDVIFSFFKERENKIISAKLIKINRNSFLEYAQKLSKDIKIPVSFGYKYFGNYATLDYKGYVIEFNKIAKLNVIDNNELDYPQLAVMRLDVDNLGSLFEFGLGDKASFSRIATLSRELDLFFSGYFNVLADKYKIYITYSGGDDAFIVGSWINVLHFAKELYEKFRKFTCNNPDITFSAGIFMCDEHYPVAKFAQKAAELEDLSKNYINTDGNKKNAVTVFDHTLNWENYCAMIDFAEKLFRYTNLSDEVKDKNKLNRSLVHRLLRVIKASLKSNGSVDVEKLYRNVAQLNYLFARHGFDAESIEKATDGIAKDIISVFLKVFSKKEIIKNYLIPTHYVVLKTRKI